MGVVASRGSHRIVVGLQQLVKPLFDGGLPVTAGNADNGYIESLSVCGGQLLQGSQRVVYNNEICICHLFDVEGQVFHDKIAYPFPVEIFDITMPVVPFGH